MDIETTSSHSPAPVATKEKTPWGVIIAILLILVIVVSGAYYAFTQRIAPPPTSIDAG